MPKKPITIAKAIVKSSTQDPAKITQAIVDIAVSARKLVNSGLTMRAICVLINDDTGASLDNIRRVLDAASQLDKKYTREG